MSVPDRGGRSGGYHARIPDNRIPWTARAPEPGRDLEIARRAPGGRNIRGLRSPRKHLELRNSEGFRSLAKELRRRPGTSELRRPPKLEMLPGANRASICPQRLKLPNLTQGLRCLLIKLNTYVHIIPCGRVSILFEQEMMVTTTMCNTGDVEIGFSREQPTYIIVNQEDQVVDGEADGSTTEAPIFFVSHGL
ncbi:hypothetical protein OsI_38914 [Oryza sativa Indica Group]|uniref:Uncharacterized protein n=1 Tax=Oryza sativa subsp. indica TaxID=39946 RepID=A2ZM57_ORYSI|nr:hypothetical protein OsI_38914 [Oryza sativa Indica Group]